MLHEMQLTQLCFTYIYDFRLLLVGRAHAEQPTNPLRPSDRWNIRHIRHSSVQPITDLINSPFCETIKPSAANLVPNHVDFEIVGASRRQPIRDQVFSLWPSTQVCLYYVRFRHEPVPTGSSHQVACRSRSFLLTILLGRRCLQPQGPELGHVSFSG